MKKYFENVSIPNRGLVRSQGRRNSSDCKKICVSIPNRGLVRSQVLVSETITVFSCQGSFASVDLKTTISAIACQEAKF